MFEYEIGGKSVSVGSDAPNPELPASHNLGLVTPIIRPPKPPRLNQLQKFHLKHQEIHDDERKIQYGAPLSKISASSSDGEPLPPPPPTRRKPKKKKKKPKPTPSKTKSQAKKVWK